MIVEPEYDGFRIEINAIPAAPGGAPTATTPTSGCCASLAETSRGTKSCPATNSHPISPNARR